MYARRVMVAMPDHIFIKAEEESISIIGSSRMSRPMGTVEPIGTRGVAKRGAT
jgi:hypothetical protein